MPCLGRQSLRAQRNCRSSKLGEGDRPDRCRNHTRLHKSRPWAALKGPRSWIYAPDPRTKWECYSPTPLAPEVSVINRIRGIHEYSTNQQSSFVEESMGSNGLSCWLRLHIPSLSQSPCRWKAGQQTNACFQWRITSHVMEASRRIIGPRHRLNYIIYRYLLESDENR